MAQVGVQKLAAHSILGPRHFFSLAAMKKNEAQKPECDVACRVCSAPECAHLMIPGPGIHLPSVCQRNRCCRRMPLVAMATRGSASLRTRRLTPFSLLWALPTSACSGFHGEIPLGLAYHAFY